jgi:hypothetical protein
MDCEDFFKAELPDYAADNGLFLDLADQIAAGRGAYGATDRIKWTTQCQLDVSNSSTQIADLASSSPDEGGPDVFVHVHDLESRRHKDIGGGSSA